MRLAIDQCQGRADGQTMQRDAGGAGGEGAAETLIERALAICGKVYAGRPK